MVEYTDEQLKIARTLLEEPKTIEELRKELDIDAKQLNEELKEMINLKVVELKNDKYKLIDYIEGQTKKEEVEGKYTIRFMIEGSSKNKEAVEAEMDKLMKKIKDEPYKKLKLRKESPEKKTIEKNGEKQETYSAFIETEVSTPKLSDIVYLIVNYGPSSVEVLEPESTEVKIDELQKSLNNMASGIHYYIGLILQLKQKLNEAQAQKLPPMPKTDVGVGL